MPKRGNLNEVLSVVASLTGYVPLFQKPLQYLDEREVRLMFRVKGRAPDYVDVVSPESRLYGRRAGQPA